MASNKSKGFMIQLQPFCFYPVRNKTCYMNKINCFWLAAFFSFWSLGASASDTTTVKSPDGRIVFSLLQQNKKLYCNISFSGKAILVNSPFNMEVGGTSIMSG